MFTEAEYDGAVIAGCCMWLALGLLGLRLMGEAYIPWGLIAGCGAVWLGLSWVVIYVQQRRLGEDGPKGTPGRVDRRGLVVIDGGLKD